MPQRPAVHRPRFAPSPAQARGTAHARGYGADWQRFRLAFLRDNPICCFENHPFHRHECTHAAMVVDHVQPLTQGGARLDRDNCRSVCRAAHDALTRNLVATGKNELPPPKLAVGGWA